MSSASDRYNAELEYLAEYVNDVLRELNWLISIDGACDEFEARGNSLTACRNCAESRLNH